MTTQLEAARDILQKTRTQLLSHPEQWGHGQYDDHCGHYCLVGTINRQHLDDNSMTLAAQIKAKSELRKLLPVRFSQVEGFNDLAGYDAVIDLLDRTIRHLSLEVMMRDAESLGLYDLPELATL